MSLIRSGTAGKALDNENVLESTSVSKQTVINPAVLLPSVTPTYFMESVVSQTTEVSGCVFWNVATREEAAHSLKVQTKWQKG